MNIIKPITEPFKQTYKSIRNTGRIFVRYANPFRVVKKRKV